MINTQRRVEQSVQMHKQAGSCEEGSRFETTRVETKNTTTPFKPYVVEEEKFKEHSVSLTVMIEAL